MLVLSRRVNERIQIGDDITITIVRISPGSVRIGVDAPDHLMIVRDELNENDRVIQARRPGSEMPAN